MNLKLFLSNFKRNPKREIEFDDAFENRSRFLTKNSELAEFLKILAGSTFEDGLYRIHTFSTALLWTIYITGYFKRYKGKIYCFAFDWLGRQFAIHKNQPQIILMFDPATAEVFELNVNLLEFHNTNLVNNKEGNLLATEFKLYTKELHDMLNFTQCVGFKIPLLLGGLDNLENYETIDMAVYWETNFQIYQKINHLPPETIIGKIDFKDIDQNLDLLN